MEIMLNQSVYICRLLTPKETKDQMNLKTMGEVRATAEQLFGKVETYKFVNFMSQLKIVLSSVCKIYVRIKKMLVYLETKQLICLK